jgi:type VI secretion system protein ImpA
MIVIEDFLKPIAEGSPSGADLRYDPVYDAIKEARREEENLKQGAWQTEFKTADPVKVISLATTALKTRTKDLQIAAWLTEALLRQEKFGGFAAGLKVLHGFIQNFWDTLYPPVEQEDEGDPPDLGLRAKPLAWLETLTPLVRNSPLNNEGHGLYLYKKSRDVGYEDQAKTPDQKKKREKLLAAGEMAPEAFDKAFNETPKSFYLNLEKQLDATLVNLAELGAICDEKFKDEGPSFGKLKELLQEVRHLAHSLLEKKREKEPDPVEVKPVEPGPEPEVTPESGTGEPTAPSDGFAQPARPAPSAITFTVGPSSESASRQDLVKTVAAAAAALRQKEPYNPAPYLMMRGLRWGDLRTAAAQTDPAMLEAPPTEIRQQIKRLSLAEKWKDLLDAAEAVMALPCSRAWLDLQRFVVEACVSLGPDYDPIAVAIRSELRALLQDVPHLMDATLMDDTPAANSKTRDWLKEILAEHGGSPCPPSAMPLDEPPALRWQKKFVDSMVLAKEAVRGGQADKAIDIMNQELSRQRSARGRFQRRLQFIEICVSAGKDAIVQPMLDDLIATIDAHKLEEWEDKAYMASAIVSIMKASKKIQADAKEKQKYFERVCRLDPAQALNC